MDSKSYEMVKWFVNFVKLEDKPLEILDIGSMDLNGSHRDLFPNPKWSYTGLDIEEGKNVDIVSLDLYHYPLQDNFFDVVISGQCIEHVEDIYAWSDEAIRVLKPGGVMCITAPISWEEHRYPFDCWRFYPDGLRWLFVKRVENMKEIIIRHDGRNIMGAFKKVSL